MKYYPHTLKDLILQCVKDRALRKQLMVYIAYGLATIHKEGLAHNDLKPANIFISKVGIPKIGYFGLATAMFATDMRGTRDFAAPEMFNPKRCYGDKVHG